jgi:hypothetical protein
MALTRPVSSVRILGESPSLSEELVTRETRERGLTLDESNVAGPWTFTRVFRLEFHPLAFTK